MTPPNNTELSDEEVAALVRLAALDVTPDRRPAIADRAREMLRLAADLDGLDLAGLEPAAVYDPTWTEEDAA